MLIVIGSLAVTRLKINLMFTTREETSGKLLPNHFHVKTNETAMERKTKNRRNSTFNTNKRIQKTLRISRLNAVVILKAFCNEISWEESLPKNVVFVEEVRRRLGRNWDKREKGKKGNKT